MTNQTIPPCPVCGVVPEVDLCYTPTSVVVCCQLHPAYSVDTVLWVDLCDLHLGRALRASGIETVEQLKGRLAPDKDYTFLLSIIHWAITFWDAVPNDTVMHYTPLPKGIDLNYLRDLVKGVKYPPRLADDSPVAPDPRVAVLDDVRLLTENAIRYAHLAYCRTLEREPEYLAEMKRIVAAQRGEGNGE